MRKWPCYAILALVLTISTTWATVYEGSKNPVIIGLKREI